MYFFHIRNSVIYRYIKKNTCWAIYRKIGEDEEEDDFTEEGDEENADEESQQPPQASEEERKIIEEKTSMVVSYFFFSIVWSIGATLDLNSRLKFDEFFRSLCEMDATTSKYPK